MHKYECIKKTITTYEKTAEDYDRIHHDIEEIRWMIDCFMKELSGTKVLDLGCGPGRDARYFTDHGLQVTGIDLTKKFIDIASRKVPKATFIYGDMRDLNLPDNSFDGIWACASLLHIPKEEAKKTMKNLYRMMNEGGIIHISVKEGHGEKMITKDDAERFFAFYTEDELKYLMESCGLKITENCKQTTDKRWIAFLGKKI